MYQLDYLLFVIRGRTTQGDPTALAAYAIAVAPLLKFLFDYIESKNHRTKKVALADDFTAAGINNELKLY